MPAGTRKLRAKPYIACLHTPLESERRGLTRFPGQDHLHSTTSNASLQYRDSDRFFRPSSRLYCPESRTDPGFQHFGSV
jgi:hypothetical protein